MSQSIIIGTSLASFLGPSFIGCYTHYKIGNLNTRMAPFLVIGSMFGSYLASRVALNLDDLTLKWIFGIMMVILGVRQIRF